MHAAKKNDQMTSRLVICSNDNCKQMMKYNAWLKRQKNNIKLESNKGAKNINSYTHDQAPNQYTMLAYHYNSRDCFKCSCCKSIIYADNHALLQTHFDEIYKPVDKKWA